MTHEPERCAQYFQAWKRKSWDHGGMIVTLQTRGLKTLAQVQVIVSSSTLWQPVEYVNRRGTIAVSEPPQPLPFSIGISG